MTNGTTSPTHLRIDSRLVSAFEAGALPRELLIAGPAGTGKTWPILAFLHLLAKEGEGLRILICRQTRRSLTDSVLVTYEQEVLPADGLESLAYGASRDHRSRYAYPSGSEIVVGGLDRPDKILSTSWDVIYVNEAIEVSEAAWDTLLSRLNRPGRPSWLGHLIGDTNPGDPGHWLKKRCDDGRTALWDTRHEANPALYDGRDWTDAGRAYRSRLDRLRGTRRKRLLEGVWAAGEGQWFDAFGDAHVSPLAEYDRRFPVHLAVDSGVHTGAVFFQVQPGNDGPLVTVFGDHYVFNAPAFAAAGAVLDLAGRLCDGRIDRPTTDPAGRAATGVGPTVLGEYARAGFRPDAWPSYPGSVQDGLSLVESFVSVEPPGLLVHPRCARLIEAFANYKRAQRGGQWVDRPEDPQHPHEDLLDALRGGLQDKFPEGRRPAPVFRGSLSLNRFLY